MNTSPHVFLIEDNEDDVLLTRRALGRAPAVRLSVACDGAQALEMLDNELKEDLPDLFLVDINMPRLSGLDLLTHLRRGERTRLLPVVMLSTSDLAHDLFESYGRGANSFIRKPIDSHEFREALASVKSYWLSLNSSATPRRSVGRL